MEEESGGTYRAIIDDLKSRLDKIPIFNEKAFTDFTGLNTGFIY